MTERHSAWSVTINNPSQTDEYNIAQARQRGWKVTGQLERGANGTEHYQLLLQTSQVRFAAVKKAFPRAHIEPARNLTALVSYVQKDDTRVAPLRVDQSKYPSQLQIFDWYSSYYYQVKKSYPAASNLEIFDLMCGQKIRQGFYIGAECMNPQIRAFIKKFGDHLAHRHRKTDRQTDENNISSSLLNAASLGLSKATSSSRSSSPSSSSSVSEGESVDR